MKNFLNEWKKFLINEQKRDSTAPNIPYSDETLESNYSVFLDNDAGEYFQIVLYRKEKYVDNFYIIGYSTVGLLTDPDPEQRCIPRTYQISAIYVEPELQGMGFGKLLYDLSFAVLPKGAGLTSDKLSGTEEGAKVIWKKLENSSEYTHRETPKGNDTFDYTGDKTPEDPDDDCFVAASLGSKNATDYSIQKKNNSQGQQLLQMMISQHEQNDFMDRGHIEYKLLDKATKRFSKIYTDVSLGI